MWLSDYNLLKDHLKLCPRNHQNLKIDFVDHRTVVLETDDILDYHRIFPWFRKKKTSLREFF